MTDNGSGPESATLLVTGGAGFIGSALVRIAIRETPWRVVVVDKLTYAGNMDSLAPVADSARFAFERVDICDRDGLQTVFDRYRPNAVLHLAAESHVDRSIDDPGEFVSTNVLGTFRLLEEARRYWGRQDEAGRARFRFVHVSTDEVFGSLGDSGRFTEASPYQPNSPYSASKAGSDHLARAWYHTYGLPVIITNCSNNYGPCQFPEKLIPLMILNGLEGRKLPVYGRGENVRDWLYVDDHARGLLAAVRAGRPGESYVFGGDAERRNIDVVRTIASVLDELAPDPSIGPRERLIELVQDRPGHDFRYAIDASRARADLGWTPGRTFEDGLRETIRWYIDNPQWWGRVRSGAYRGERLGLGAAT